MPRKKKNKAIPKRKIVDEGEGWKVGDIAWARTYVTNKVVRGEIKEFHPSDKQGVSVTLLEHVQGAYITVLYDTLSEDQPRKRKMRLRKNRKK